MTYHTPESRRASVEEVLAALQGAHTVILTTHLNADGDGAGSQAALMSLLADLDKAAWIVNPTPFPEPLEFLLPDPGRVLPAGGEEAALRCREADLCLVVDTGEKSRIGRVKPMVEHLPLVIVDHHPVGEDPLVGLELRDPEAAAAGELVFDLLWERGGPWTPSVVDGLYVALLTDTGSFRFSNATPTAHRVVAELIERGASPDRLYRRLFERSSLGRIRLIERSLGTLEVDETGGVASMVIPADAFREFECTSEDLEGLVDFPRSIAGVEVAILLREIEPGQVKVSLRSNGSVDVNALAREFGGGGHVRAAGLLARGVSVSEVRASVVARSAELYRAVTLEP